MIYLKYDIENTICVTLYDKIQSGTTIPISGSTGETYSMKLINLQTNIENEFYLNEVSANLNRYNEFKLTIDNSLSSGYYNYEFYIKNLSANTYSNVLEIGKCLVQSPAVGDVTYDAPVNNTYVYKG